MEDRIANAVTMLASSHRLVVLTGAGASRESGVPTFREKGEGLWARYDPMVVASAAGFMQDPDGAWAWHEHLRLLAQQCEPNPGHYAIAELEMMLPQVVVITQNIDDMHERAGSRDVLPIHGSLQRLRCFHNCLGDPTYLAWDDLDDFTPQGGVPHCPHCGGWVRPDIVWFGESLPERLIERAFDECERADVMLVVGTSGVIQPAASLPVAARSVGASIIDVNPDPGGITSVADLWLPGKAGEILPLLAASVRRIKGFPDEA